MCGDQSHDGYYRERCNGDPSFGFALAEQEPEFDFVTGSFVGHLHLPLLN
jgi:hypothetical protein